MKTKRKNAELCNRKMEEEIRMSGFLMRFFGIKTAKQARKQYKLMLN